MNQQPTYQRLKQVVFFAMIALLFLPMIQHKFRFFEETPLEGSYVLSEKVPLNQTNWFSGKYQEGQELYITEHTGFRPGWVRLYNQWNYSLFDKVSVKGVVVGKEDYLNEVQYIHTYYGEDFIGEEKVAKLTKQWKQIQDTLERKGVSLVVILAPGKGSFYPEFIPEQNRKDQRGPTNYAAFKKQFQKQEVSCIDMHSWFESMKKTANYPLFSKTGVHWTAYGQFLAVDSMTKFVSKIGGREIPHFVLDGITLSNTTQLNDDDIEKGMNLLRDIPDKQLAYPKFHVNRKAKPGDPKVLVIGDSFYWGLFNANVSGSLFNNSDFWYYNNQVYPASYTTETLVKDQEFDRELRKNKVVFLLITDANLYRFGFGFIEMACKEYGIE